MVGLLDRISEPVSAELEKSMNPPLYVFSGRKLVSRAIRWRLAVALGAATVMGASAVAVASPARADDVVQDCNTYHNWTECISYDYTNGNLAVNALNSGNAGNHSVWMVNTPPSEVFSASFNFSAGHWVGFAEHTPPRSEVCGGIDSTTIVCSFSL
jgi:hypothetical protein